MKIAENETRIDTNAVQVPLNRKTVVSLDPVYVEYKKSRSTFMMFTLGLKRFIDLFGSAVGIVLLAPLFLVVSIAIKLDSPGPVFFRQGRLGYARSTRL